MSAVNYQKHRVLGMVVSQPESRPPVAQTRTVTMPNGKKLLCRLRKYPEGPQWTAEIPIEIAKDIYSDD